MCCRRRQARHGAALCAAGLRILCGQRLPQPWRVQRRRLRLRPNPGLLRHTLPGGFWKRRRAGRMRPAASAADCMWPACPPAGMQRHRPTGQSLPAAGWKVNEARVRQGLRCHPAGRSPLAAPAASSTTSCSAAPQGWWTPPAHAARLALSSTLLAPAALRAPWTPAACATAVAGLWTPLAPAATRCRMPTACAARWGRSVV